MKPTDLDDARDYANHRDHSRAQCKNGDRLILALVAELRAARQQLEEYEHLRSTLVARFGLGSALRPSRVATQVIAAYDHATKEPPP